MANSVITERPKGTSIATPTFKVIGVVAGGSNDLRSIIGVEDKLFIATGAGTAGEIRAFSIASPNAPSFLFALSVTHKAYEISLVGGKAFTANGDGKLQVAQVCGL